MKQILCSRLGHSILLVSKKSRYPISVINTRILMSGSQSRIYRPLLAAPYTRNFRNLNRTYVMLVGNILKGALRLRYLLLGGAVGGGLTLRKKYEQWKEGLPDTAWLNDLLPNDKQWEKFRGSLIAFKKNIADKVDVDPRIKEYSENKYKEYRAWFNQRLDNAIKAAEDNQNGTEAKEQLSSSTVAHAVPLTDEHIKEEYNKTKSSRERIHAMQEELIETQLKYQREIERLERENKELRKQMLLRGNPNRRNRQIKKSLIDMYSEVLDELSEYDSTYEITDQLPRVVVVGDQSSGKTSVLEMLVQARIFPRGGGEMMTRSPVKVTLSEGPYHIAKFRDSTREFDLTKESELADLRREVELRMKNSVKKGKTISQDVISMTVTGPGLNRMVLVDLPGIISTVTIGMAEDTRELIRQMSEQYMSNPNAIILCIQDGSVDAERSNVTDIVSQMDPSGKRTIFVLTKVDLAEKNSTDPERLRKILSGKLFPMKALGYFAVVTGSGKREDSIQTIKDYEEKFFRNSKLFKTDLAMTGQVTTKNLSFAVAECFWKMVRESVEQQADAFKATRFNLEREWKNNFPKVRVLDRGELFEKARLEILDEIVNLSETPSKHWEEALMANIWDKVKTHVFENIYIPTSQCEDSGAFNTYVDIKLRQWAEQQLPARSVELGWECLQQELRNFVEQAKLSPDHEDIFDNLKNAVINEAIRRHSWEEKASHTLQVIQLNTLEDRDVHDKRDWEQAVKFLQKSLKEMLNETEGIINKLQGPGGFSSWLYWQSKTETQTINSCIKNTLENILRAHKKHDSTLSHDELTLVRTSLQQNGIEVTNEIIEKLWNPIYTKYFLKQKLTVASDCKNGYYLHHNGHGDEIDCNDVVLFWRIQKMLQVTSKALRQQIMNREARTLDEEIKEVLEEFSQDNELKQMLITGRRVTLGEEIKRVKAIQEKLEEFVQALNVEK